MKRLEDLQEILPDQLRNSGRALQLLLLGIALLILIVCLVLGALLCIQIHHHGGIAMAFGQGSLYSGSGSCPSMQCLETAARMAENMDTSVNPCDNFYKFACAGWEKRNYIQPDEVETSIRYRLGKANLERRRELLDSPVQRTGSGSSERKLKEFWQSCLHDFGRMQEGGRVFLNMIKDKLKGLYILDPDGWKNNGWNLQNAIATVMGEFNVPLMFRTNIGKLYSKSQYVILLQTGGISLWKGAYTQDRFDHHRDAYKTYMRSTISALLEDGNVTLDDSSKQVRIEQFVDDAFGQEKKLAQLWIDGQADGGFWQYNKIPLREIERNFTQVQWRQIIQNIYPGHYSLSGDTIIYVRHLPYIRRLNSLLENETRDDTKDRVMNNYMLWRLMAMNAEHLSWKYTYARRLYRDISYGQTEVVPTWRRCMDTVTQTLAYSLYATYLHQHVGTDNRNQVSAMFGDIQTSFRKRLESVPWMDNYTATVAQQKIMNVEKEFGLPGDYFDETFVDQLYEPLSINKSEGYFPNYLRAVKFRQTLVGKSLEGTQAKIWHFSPIFASLGTDPFYAPYNNMYLVPAGGMQYPLFVKDGPAVFNYGALGSLMGKSLTRAVNQYGRRYLSNGTASLWWTDVTMQRYNGEKKCFDDYYNGTVLGPFNVDGQQQTVKLKPTAAAYRMIDEVAGYKSAFYGYRSKGVLPEQVPSGLNMTADQLFFLAAAQTKCFLTTDKAAYADAKYSYIQEDAMLNGALSHTEEFAMAFGCPKSSPMAQTDVCRVF